MENSSLGVTPTGSGHSDEPASGLTANAGSVPNAALRCISYPATMDPKVMLAAVRSDVFSVLRRHEVTEQCFAEIAMVTQAAISAWDRRAPTTGE